MLIMNQNRDVLFDTTGGMIRIAYRETTKKYVVLGINGGYGSVEISTHDTEEDAKKAVLLIHLANAAGLDSWDFYGDMSKLDDAIKGLRSVADKRMLKAFRGERI